MRSLVFVPIKGRQGVNITYNVSFVWTFLEMLVVIWCNMIKKPFDVAINTANVTSLALLCGNIQFSDFIVTNTGSPQGCVLSAFLFTLYTLDCQSRINVILNRKTDAYFAQIEKFHLWCNENYLDLNVKKINERNDYRFWYQPCRRSTCH